MCGEKIERNLLEDLRDFISPEQPYTGEVRDPVNELDRMVLTALTVHGVDPDPVQNRYIPEHVPSINPNAVEKDDHKQYIFGANYLTRHFDISDEFTLVLAYNKKKRLDIFGVPEVVIDTLKPGGGLESRTKFSSNSNDGLTILKSIVTKFGSDYPSKLGLFYHWQSESEDFTRSLGQTEISGLRMLIEKPEDQNGLVVAKSLTSINDDEKKLIEENRADAEKQKREHQETLEKNRGGGFIPTDMGPKIEGFTTTPRSPRRT